MRNFVSRFASPALVLAVLVATPSPAFAGKLFGKRRGRAHQVQYRTVPCQAASVVPVVPTGQMTPAAQQPVATAGVVSGDAAGFLNWLNATRARYGLGAVQYDAEAEAWCHENNRHQAAKGMNHWVMGCHRRQNAAAGLNFPGVESAWMQSPGHASALLDPTIRFVGIAWYGAYCTFGAY